MAGSLLPVAVEILGWIGMALIIGAYFLVTVRRVDSSSLLYQWMNVIGALGLIVNGAWNHAYPSTVLNVIWAGIGFYALAARRSR
jgi:hypothetical protein